MKKVSFSLLFAVFISCFIVGLPITASSQNQNSNQVKIKWVKGPNKASMDGIASVKIPKGYVFADGDDTRVIMKYYGNIETNKEVGYLAPDSHKWFIVFEFDKVGFIKDEEGASLDADAMLKSIQESNKRGNEIRRENGMPELDVTGWYKKPAYDPKTNNLEWATNLKSKSGSIVNYNIRYLGRKGVMEVVVVSDPKDLKAAISRSKRILRGYEFTSGNKYTEFVEGDKVAEYGLTALVTGGALAAAAKSGLLQKFWKLILGGLLAVGALFKGIFGRKDKSETVEETVSEIAQEESKESENT